MHYIKVEECRRGVGWEILSRGTFLKRVEDGVRIKGIGEGMVDAMGSWCTVYGRGDEWFQDRHLS